jgi:hypothetical protein
VDANGEGVEFSTAGRGRTRTPPAVEDADHCYLTGDKLLLQDAGMKGRVISPQAFVAGV